MADSNPNKRARTRPWILVWLAG